MELQREGNMGNMELKKDGNIYILNVTDSINAENIDEFKKKISELKEQEAQRVVVNLNYIDFMLSESMGQLVSLLKSIKLSGGHIVLTGIGPKIRRIFNITRLDLVFDIAESFNEAMERVKK